MSIAHAEDCSAYAFPTDAAGLTVATVITPRASFFRDTPECPAAGASCKTAAYVVKGDLVFTGRTVGAYTCAAFVGSTKQVTGWMLNSSLVPAVWPGAFGDWNGEWLRVRGGGADRAHVVIRSSGKTITANFEATLTVNPDNVRSGAASGTLHFTPRGIETLATLSDGDQANATCKVTLRRSRDFLIVSDGATPDGNSDCGGMGVTLSGIYRRIPTKR